MLLPLGGRMLNESTPLAPSYDAVSSGRGMSARVRLLSFTCPSRSLQYTLLSLLYTLQVLVSIPEVSRTSALLAFDVPSPLLAVTYTVYVVEGISCCSVRLHAEYSGQSHIELLDERLAAIVV